MKALIGQQRLYHYERKWGTTTDISDWMQNQGLYHYERKWGTTTDMAEIPDMTELYHYERKWGTGNYDNVSATNIP